jgi:sterol carrier protein 2
MVGWDKGPMTAQIFGNAGIEYMEKYGAKPEHFAEIARVNHAHRSESPLPPTAYHFQVTSTKKVLTESVNNPYSQFHDVYTLEQIMSSPIQHKFMTKLQCCPTSDGSAAVVLCSQKFLDSHPELKSQAIEIAGQSMATDDVALLGGSAIELVGAEMTRRAARDVYEESGIGPEDVQVVECHDCFSANEMYRPLPKDTRRCMGE